MSKHRKHYLGVATLAMAAIAAMPAWAVNYDDAAHGNWSAPATWGVGSGYPGSGAGDTATINSSANIAVDVSPAIDALTLTGGFWYLSNGLGPNTVTVDTLNVYSNGEIGSNVTLAVTGAGLNTQNSDQFRYHGTLAIESGATFATTGLRWEGTGDINIEPGGTFAMNEGFAINYYANVGGRMAIDNDGVFQFNKTGGTFYNNVGSITGDGEWQINGAGTMRFQSGTFALNPSTALWTGSAGTVQLYSGGTLGAFAMSGSNTIDFSASSQINRASTFQDAIVRGSVTLDLNPAGGSVTHTVNGTLNPNGTSWKLDSTGGTATLNVATLNYSNYGTIASGVTLNVTGGGSWTTNQDAQYIYGTVNLQGGTLSATGFRLRGNGNFNVQPGATLALNPGAFGINYNDSGLSFDNDGIVDFNSTGTFHHLAQNITGDGAWNINGTGTLNVGKTGTTLSLNPATGSWTGNAGTVIFDARTPIANVGGFSMGGSNTVHFRNNTYNIDRASSFQNVTIDSTATVDLNPAGAGSATHAINGTLSITGNAIQILKSSSAAGAVLNAAGLNNSTSNHFDIGSNVTLNLTGAGSMGGSYQDIYGIFNVRNGATFTLGGSNNRLRGNGRFEIESGGTVNVNGPHSINYYDGGASGMTIDNDGLVTFNNSGTYSIYAYDAIGDGYWLVNSSANAGGVLFGAVEGWSGSGAFNNYATWHVIGSNRFIDLPGGANSMTAIGPNATIIIDNNGKIYEFNNSSRNNVTVNGKLAVLGTTNLLFNAGQGVTVSSTGTLQGNAAISGYVTSSGTVIPGASIGTLTVNGNFSSTGTLEVEIDGAASDQIVVNGTVTVGGHVDVQLLSSPTAAEYVIIANDGTDAVTGNFDQQCYVLDGQIYELVTDGGDGNDVALQLASGCDDHAADFYAKLCALFAANPPVSFQGTYPLALQAANETVTEFGLSPCCVLVYMQLFEQALP